MMRDLDWASMGLKSFSYAAMFIAVFPISSESNPDLNTVQQASCQMTKKSVSKAEALPETSSTSLKLAVYIG